MRSIKKYYIEFIGGSSLKNKFQPNASHTSTADITTPNALASGVFYFKGKVS